MYFTLIALVFAASGTAFTQGYVMPSEPVLVSMPKAIRPPNSWLWAGNSIKVNVSVDKKGRVSSVDSIDGPGFTCPNAKLSAVVIIREAAKSAAMNAVFIPAKIGKKTFTSIARIEVMFPDLPEGGTQKSYDETNLLLRSNKPTHDPPRIPQSILNTTVNGRATSLPKPAYPSAARAEGLSGSVLVNVFIVEDGTIASAEPVSGHPILREAARIAACNAKFSPTLLSGQPIKITGSVTYNFHP